MSQLDGILQSMIADIVAEKLQNTELEAERILNVTEAANYLKVSRSWMYQNISELPFADVGGYKFLKSDLDKYVREKTKKQNVQIKDHQGSGRDYRIV